MTNSANADRVYLSKGIQGTGIWKKFKYILFCEFKELILTQLDENIKTDKKYKQKSN